MIKKLVLLAFISFLFTGFVCKPACHCQSAEKFIILNLHWNNRTIALNNLHVAHGILKPTRVTRNGHKFLYRVFSHNQAVLDQNYFEVPRGLYFDYSHGETEGVGGGRFERPAVDFVVKIPAHEHSARIVFYRLNDTHETTPLLSANRVTEAPGELVGEINLP